MQRVLTIISLLLIGSTGTDVIAQDQTQTDRDVVWIGLAHGSAAEAAMARELRDVLRTHDVEPWIMTRKVLIDSTKIPHSHPVLTLHTRHIGAELELLATFVHEQLHWLEDEPWLGNFEAAMADFEKMYPNVPSSREGGARDRQSTYRHLLVCDMELQALTILVGRETARKILAKTTHYEWIYDKVLGDPRIREIALLHGFDLANGVPTTLAAESDNQKTQVNQEIME